MRFLVKYLFRSSFLIFFESILSRTRRTSFTTWKKLVSFRHTTIVTQLMITLLTRVKVKFTNQNIENLVHHNREEEQGGDDRKLYRVPLELCEPISALSNLIPYGEVAKSTK